MTDVAAAAGVSPGLLYTYAESKEALFALVVQRESGVDIAALPLPVATASDAELVALVRERARRPGRGARPDRGRVHRRAGRRRRRGRGDRRRALRRHRSGAARCCDSSSAAPPTGRCSPAAFYEDGRQVHLDRLAAYLDRRQRRRAPRTDRRHRDRRAVRDRDHRLVRQPPLRRPRRRRRSTTTRCGARSSLWSPARWSVDDRRRRVDRRPRRPRSHLATASFWGYHRDEFYYLACGRRLAWGYVDHPPLTPLLYRLADITVGSSPVRAARSSRRCSTASTCCWWRCSPASSADHSRAQLIARRRRCARSAAAHDRPLPRHRHRRDDRWVALALVLGADRERRRPAPVAARRGCSSGSGCSNKWTFAVGGRRARGRPAARTTASVARHAVAARRRRDRARSSSRPTSAWQAAARLAAARVRRARSATTGRRRSWCRPSCSCSDARRSWRCRACGGCSATASSRTGSC